MDKATQGVIYISFGSYIEISQSHKNLLEILIWTIEKFPNYTFLWKSDGNGVKFSKNVVIRKWFPQQDILGIRYKIV